MKVEFKYGWYWRVVSLGALALSLILCATRASSMPAHDGQDDFDFNVGTWRTRIKRLVRSESGADTWIEQNGTVVVEPIWNGRGELEQIEADGPTGHWEGLTLFLYNPQAHQWSESYANSKDGILNAPMVGEFKDGRGEFFAQDDDGGRTVLVRGVWSDIQKDSHRYEISLRGTAVRRGSRILSQS
ncbi:MAG TPA: hypothetical protein VGR81_09145 [Candidatus Acidoferrales bacterium]|nr:hypothetical protein [Candidatus Acidoferrales bacterium]